MKWDNKPEAEGAFSLFDGIARPESAHWNFICQTTYQSKNFFTVMVMSPHVLRCPWYTILVVISSCAVCFFKLRVRRAFFIMNPEIILLLTDSGKKKENRDRLVIFSWYFGLISRPELPQTSMRCSEIISVWWICITASKRKVSFGF